jgi:pimeloyl-ACP methyl ester carboxylesterase
VVLLSCLIIMVASLSACGTGSQAVSLRSERTGTIQWTPCGNVQCGTLSVPLDRRHPQGKTIQLALARLPASGSRVGVLFTNPGGPGASGIAFLRAAAVAFPSSIRKSFDLVSWDPRGVGASAPVQCERDLDAFYAVDHTPDNAGEVAKNVAAAKKFDASCEQRSGASLPFVSTEDSARDMDAIRAAMGTPQLNYIGYSYGTLLGALYAHMFPQHLRAMVLDGAVDPSLTYEQSTVQQAVGFERELDAFFKYCKGNKKCGFATGSDPAAAYDSLVSDVDAEPQFATVQGERRTLGPGEFDLGVADALYSGRPGFSTLASALAQTARGLGSKLLALSDDYTGREPGAKYDNETAALYAIGCLDAPSPRTLSGMRSVAAVAAKAAPRFGASDTWLGLPCAYWPIAATGKIGPIHAPNAPPIVVIGNVGDPATPYQWAQSLARQLDTGHLLTFDGDGHTAFGRGDPCIDGTVTSYLVQLKVPAAGKHCT